MTAVSINKKENTSVYAIYCFFVLAAGCISRGVKKLCRGKCSKAGQTFFSLLAFLCLGGAVCITAAAEGDHISFLSALLGGAALMGGFGLFAGMAGAFRPYRYLKKRAKRTSSRHMVCIAASNAKRKSA